VQPLIGNEEAKAGASQKGQVDESSRTVTGVAVVGLGYWGPNWVRNFQSSGRCDRVIACDLDEKRRRHVKRLYPSVETAEVLDDVLKDPQIMGVVVATPVHSHFGLAKRCLLAGKSVLVEKPLAASVEQAAELIRLARTQSLVLMVGHTFEYSAAVNRIREVVESGELGEIFYISAIRTNLGLIQQGINVVWDLAPHDLSIILSILGRAPESVNCQGRAHYNPGIEDVAMVTLNFSNNVMAFVHLSWLDPNKTRRTTIVGSRKMMVYDDISPQEPIRVYDKGVNVLPQYETFGEFHFSYRYGDILIPRIPETEPLRVETEHFMDCMIDKIKPRTDGMNGLRVVSVLEATDLSLRQNGATVPVKYGLV
jgi:predicted dehydrogenase